MKSLLPMLSLALLVAAGATASDLVPDWESTGGPPGQTAYDVVDTADGTVLLATPDGVWRREPGADRWTASGLVGTSITSVGRAGDGTVFACNGSQYGSVVYRSDDDGTAWRQFMPGLPPAARTVFDFEPGLDGAMLAATNDGVYRLDPVSDEWRRYSIPFSAGAVATAAGSVLACGINHVFRSDDDGATWQATLVADDVLLYSLDAADDGLVVAVAQLSDYWLADDGVVFVSEDLGASFRLADGDAGEPGAIGLRFGFDVEILTDGTILVGGYRELPTNPGGGVRASTDRGATWFSTGIDWLDVWRVEQLDDGRTWVAGSESVMVDVGQGWEPAGDGLSGVDVWSLTSTPSGLVAGARVAGAFLLSAADDGWRWLGPFHVWVTDTAATAGGGFVTATLGAGIRRWEPASGWATVGPDDGTPGRVAADAAGTICATFGNAVRCTSDGGASWIETSLRPWYEADLVAVPGGGFVAALRVISTGIGRLVRSTDGGATWTVTLESAVAVAGLAWDDRRRQLWAVCEDGEVAVSADLGATWEGRGNAGPSATSIAADAHGRLFAGLGSGAVRASADAGLTWRPFGPGAPRGPVLALEVHHGALYAAVEDAGVWSTPLPPPWRPTDDVARRPAEID